jgi:hypothetical protein
VTAAAPPGGGDDGVRLSSGQRRWLKRGLGQPGGKLPLFDENGQRVSPRTVQSCIEHGWAEPWFSNPLKPDWLVCKLTERGRSVLTGN